jgi:hypothetical protein
VAIHLGDVASSFLPNSCSLYGARPTLDGNGNGNGTSRAHLFDRPRQIFNLHPPCSSVATADVIRICIAHTHTSPHAVGRRGVGSTQKQRWRAARDREREGVGSTESGALGQRTRVQFTAAANQDCCRFLRPKWISTHPRLRLTATSRRPLNVQLGSGIPENLDKNRRFVKRLVPLSILLFPGLKTVIGFSKREQSKCHPCSVGTEVQVVCTVYEVLRYSYRSWCRQWVQTMTSRG